MRVRRHEATQRPELLYMNEVALDQVRRLEAALCQFESASDMAELTAHHFCDGMYARELFIPAGFALVGKMHASRNFFVLVKGTLILATPNGPMSITAPYMSVTEPGDKRAGYAVTDCVCLNFHSNPDDEQDLAVLESRYITPEALPAPERELIA